jgi:hypothetical protein
MMPFSRSKREVPVKEKKTVLKTKTALILVLAVIAVQFLLWNTTARTVKAEQRAAQQAAFGSAPLPGCASVTSAGNGLAQFPGSYPVFACSIDFQGLGQPLLVIGYVMAHTPGIYEVAILDGTGHIRSVTQVGN